MTAALSRRGTLERGGAVPLRGLLAALLIVPLLAGCGTRAPGAGGGSASGGYLAGYPSYSVGPPYEVDGVWYHPAVDYDYDRTGTASWYGAKFQNKYTANGEIFDLNGLTGAHTTLPLPSVVQVTNLENGRSIRLRVNDRGPFVGGRIIDVTRRAAQLLGFETEGTARVRVKVLKRESIRVAELAKMHEGGGVGEGGVVVAAASNPVAPNPPPQALPQVPVEAVAEAPLPPPTAPDRSRPVMAGPVVAGSAHHLFIQAGAFAVRGNARRVRARIAPLGSVEVMTASVNGVEVYRVRLGPFSSVAAADALLGRVVDRGYPGARIVLD